MESWEKDAYCLIVKDFRKKCDGILGIMKKYMWLK